MHRQDTDILLNTFFIKKKRYRVLFNFDTIIWEKETDSKQNDKTIIPVSDIIAIQQQSDNHQRSANDANEQSSLRAAATAGGAAAATASSAQKRAKLFLTVHYAKRVIKSPQDCNRWRRQTVILYSSDARIVAQWHGTLQKCLKEQNRVQSVLVFINPFGGQKKGLVTYEKYCKPLFQLANIDASCIISQRANQIHDIMMTHNLDQYDAVCCVGGDGTFAEVVNGLLFRTMKDLDLDVLKPKYIPKPKIPVAVIPAGSTDTVAFSLHGTHDVVTAAIHMVLGQKRGLDICSVENANGLIRFCASVMSYGYLGDVALQSEKYRWMGTKRYEYAGFKNFLLNASYHAEVRVLLSSSDVETDQSVASSQETIIDQDQDQKCFVNCHRCTSSSFLANEVYKLHDSNRCSLNEECETSTTASISPRGSNLKLDSHKTPAVNTTNNSNSTCDNLFKKSDSNLRVIEKSNDFYHDSYASHIESSVRPEQSVWKAIKGGFFMISGANITCACSRSPNGMSKYSHLGDGSIDLILVHKTTFLNNIRLLIKMVNKDGDIRDLPFVEIYRTKKFYFRAQSNEELAWDGSCHPINNDENGKTSQWNCDGEIVHDLEIAMSSHCQLLDVFMRGPYPFNKDAAASSCCGSIFRTSQ